MIMKQEVLDEGDQLPRYDVICNTVAALQASTPRLVVDLQTLKNSAPKQVGRGGSIPKVSAV